MPMERVGRADWITKVEFHTRLGRWFRGTEEPIVGDPAADGRTSWIWVRDGHRLAHLSADSTRTGVAEYLDLLRERRDCIEWAVIPSAAGNLTKIAFGPDRATVPGFHLYIDPSTLPHR
jgi:hypothetical protein